ncbi:MAG: Hemoglobin-like protein HbO, partial [uncultured Nocardioides sp.]
ELLRRDRRRDDDPHHRRHLLRRRGRGRGAAPALPRGGPRARRRAVHAVPHAVLGRPHDLLRGSRAPAAAHAARALRGDAPDQGALAQALPRRPRRRAAHPRAGPAVLGLRHPRRAVHGQLVRV